MVCPTLIHAPRGISGPLQEHWQTQGGNWRASVWVDGVKGRWKLWIRTSFFKNGRLVSPLNRRYPPISSHPHGSWLGCPKGIEQHSPQKETLWARRYFPGTTSLGVPAISIPNPGIRIFLENLRKPRENGSGFRKNDG